MEQEKHSKNRQDRRGKKEFRKSRIHRKCTVLEWQHHGLSVSILQYGGNSWPWVSVMLVEHEKNRRPCPPLPQPFLRTVSVTSNLEEWGTVPSKTEQACSPLIIKHQGPQVRCPWTGLQFHCEHSIHLGPTILAAWDMWGEGNQCKYGSHATWVIKSLLSDPGSLCLLSAPTKQ